VIAVTAIGIAKGASIRHTHRHITANARNLCSNTLARLILVRHLNQVNSARPPKIHTKVNAQIEEINISIHGLYIYALSFAIL
jgi:hypothetical protein